MKIISRTVHGNNYGIEGAINDAMDEWDDTDSNTEGSLQMDRVSLEGSKTGDDFLRVLCEEGMIRSAYL